MILGLNFSPGQTFIVGDSLFLLNGKPFQIISGEMHYARIPPEYWRDRLLKARAMGLNTVATYVFWNVHEPHPGVFNFSGSADVARFVRTAQELGLRVILRPGPYACAEWDFGGFPSWLLKDHSLKVRSADPRFLDACASYFHRLGQELAPLQITRGGPIIMVQVENEYGSFGRDTAYVGRIRNMIREAGFDVPLFNADGPTQMPNAFLPDVFPGVNGATGSEVLTTIRRYRPHGPFFVPEFYPGWLDHWGEPHAHVDPQETARDFDWLLAHGVSVNIYMLHGGTNFGFMNGANFGGRYQPQPTSYDYDAPLDEAGRPTVKYVKLRDVIRNYLPPHDSLPPLPTPLPVVEVPSFDLSESAGMFDRLPPKISSLHPLGMEDVGQSYGYLLYRHVFKYPATGDLQIDGLHDYAVLCLDGKKIGSLDRRNKGRKIFINIRTVPAILDILVENGGRINYGREMVSDRKGITGSVSLETKEILDWDLYPFPMDSEPVPAYHGDIPPSGPVFFHGKFQLGKTGDTFLDMRGWGKGCVWVNGHNLGRFWYIGPQQTLYLPGCWLNGGENEITLLDLEPTGCHTIRGLSSPVLDSLVTDRLKPPLPQREKRKILFSKGDLVKAGSFLPGDNPQDVTFTATAGRYVCLRSLSSQRNDHFASIAEFYLLGKDGRLLPRDTWKIYAVDSEELQSEDGQAENAFDDDPETIWHTEWGSAQPDHPHYLAIDLGSVHEISGFRYIPRIQERPGKIRDYKFYVRKLPFAFEDSTGSPQHP